jgi:hypothetical protein
MTAITPLPALALALALAELRTPPAPAFHPWTDIEIIQMNFDKN